ncbi:hypothetical protein [Clostridium beijerinckii]|uniref:hypothetical protein n=1 Tax=Clostridium beijerinckii TaxID=1520 RepID=UPI00080A5AF7|nr:hypothetical protein [Clostridium beijerinckii]OCA99399.1 hypothetical protein BGS1_09145 [Clostridium beijerinckii]
MNNNEKAENIKLKEIEDKKKDDLECFVIMPISDQDGYNKGHFKRVYEDIFIPAIQKSGFKPYRADDAKSSSVIHTAILRRLLEAPMAICDLSSRNPNVLYELGIRQAFDKPVVLVGDDDPSKIFDIGNINTYVYRKSLNYREVIEDQNKITEMLVETFNNPNKELNSLISTLKIDSALSINANGKEFNESDVIKIMYQEIMSLKDNIREISSKLRDNKESVVTTDNIKIRSADRLKYKKEFNQMLRKGSEISVLMERGDILPISVSTFLDDIDTFIENNMREMTGGEQLDLLALKNEIIELKDSILDN